MRAPRRKPWIDGRLTALLVFFCLLVQQTAVPIHLLTDDHCRVVDPTSIAATPGRACRHADEHRAHHAHFHDGGGCNHHDADAARPDTECPDTDCPDGHCPHPVTEHLASWVGVTPRAAAKPMPSSVQPTVAVAVAAVSVGDLPPDRVAACELIRGGPTPPSRTLTPASPRAPPGV